MTKHTVGKYALLAYCIDIIIMLMIIGVEIIITLLIIGIVHYGFTSVYLYISHHLSLKCI